MMSGKGCGRQGRWGQAKSMKLAENGTETASETERVCSPVVSVFLSSFQEPLSGRGKLSSCCTAGLTVQTAFPGGGEGKVCRLEVTGWMKTGSGRPGGQTFF